MPKTIIRSTISFAFGLIALHLIGAISPGIFTWGFHFLAYLPTWAILVYGLPAVVGLFFAARGSLRGLIERLSSIFTKNPGSFLAAAIGIFICAAFIFRIKVPLLGDSFILIKLYQNSLTGGHPFPASHQPLSLFFFYYCAKLFGTIVYPQMMNAFFWSELGLGAAFILIVYFTAHNLFSDPGKKVLAFCLLLFLPYMQLFFGYVEIYSVILVLLSLVVLLAILYLQSRISFFVVPLAYLFIFLAHYLNALLFPSLFYLTYIEFRRNGLKHIFKGLILVAIVVGLGILLLGNAIDRFIPPPRSTPLLTITPSGDIFQAYTLFSFFHLIDLINLAILLCPTAIVLIIVTIFYDKKALIESQQSVYFLTTLLPFVFFFLISKFDLPMAQDWDVPSAYSYVIILFALYTSAKWLGTDTVPVFAVLGVVTFVNSFAYFALNSSVAPNISRVRSFIDTRISSHDGSYQSSLHLTEYFVHTQDTLNIMSVSEKFIGLYPTDKRGYSNYTLYLQQFGPSMDGKIESIFDDWLKHDQASADAQEQYANFHLDAGTRSYHEGQFDVAKSHLLRSISLNPSLADAYNSLGIVYRRLGDRDSAILLYEKTISLDPKSAYAYINLGNAYDDFGNSAKAIEWYKKALLVKPEDATIYFNLGLAYYKQHSFPEALEALRKSARLGERDAQAFLAQRGEKW